MIEQSLIRFAEIQRASFVGFTYRPDCLQLFKHVGDSGERRRPLQHLYEDAASTPDTEKLFQTRTRTSPLTLFQDSPDVQRGGIICGTQQDIGGAVPQRHHLRGEGLTGDGLGSSQTCTQHQTTGRFIN